MDLGRWEKEIHAIRAKYGRLAERARREMRARWPTRPRTGES